jgi:hypothetical protein
MPRSVALVGAVVLAAQGQLRLGPSGLLIGIDLGVALKMAAARGHDIKILSEVLPAAEAGMVEALAKDDQGAL